MKTMTLSIVAALALGCASKPVEDLPTEELDTTTEGSDSDEDEEEEEDPDDADEDNDGVTVGEGDCNDEDNKVYPGADETCNGIDDDCDDDIDEGLPTDPYYQDADGDSFGNPDAKVDSCEKPDGYVEDNTDCNDAERTANPEGEEVSFNDIDENCDGLDFGDGEECVEGALDLTMDWMDYWTWPIADSSGSIPIFAFVEGEYEMTDKYLDIDPVESTAVASDDPLKVDVQIEAEITVQTHLIASGPAGTFEQDCLLEIGPAPVLFNGQVELDLDGEVVSGEADLDYTILSEGDYRAEPYIEGAQCNFDTIDTILGYLGYGSIDDFIMDDLNDVAGGLRGQIEDDLQDWDIPAACTPGYELETSELCTDTCSFAGDGECDDGGEGSDFAICEYGTDCSDCGVRYE